MSGDYLVVDTGSIINLFASGEEVAWDQLLSGDRKLIVSDVILEELEQFALREPSGSPLKDIRAKFNDWAFPSSDPKPGIRQIKWRPDISNYEGNFYKSDGLLKDNVGDDTSVGGFQRGKTAFQTKIIDDYISRSNLPPTDPDFISQDVDEALERANLSRADLGTEAAWKISNHAIRRRPLSEPVHPSLGLCFSLGEICTEPRNEWPKFPESQEVTIR